MVVSPLPHLSISYLLLFPWPRPLAPHIPSTVLCSPALLLITSLPTLFPVLCLLDRPLTTDWGHHTGTIDWCETNYSHSRYIAEFVNSLTNFPSIFLGLYGLYHTQTQGIPLRYGLCFLGLSLIGVGSFGFHASLRWEWQLMDELPMVCASLLHMRDLSADNRFTLWLMLGIYVLIPSLALNLGLEFGDHLPCWHSTSLLPSPSKSGPQVFAFPNSLHLPVFAIHLFLYG